MISKRTVVKVCIAMTVAMLLAAPIFAANVHLKGGKKATPNYRDNGLTLTASGALAGLGNGDILITLHAEGEAFSLCTNPSGANMPPGQNPADVTVSGAQSIPEEEVKNGTVRFSVTTEAPDSPIPGAPGCPNPNWSQDILDIDFTSATIVVEQPPGTVVLVINSAL